MQEPKHNLVELADVRLTLEGGGGPVEVLRGVDLTALAGESLSIVGPSGAGKTTLLMVMAGMERPSSGQVRVAGKDLTALDEDGLALFRRAGSAWCFRASIWCPP
jgi:putative ABC transport system ATP-binding protein